MGLSFVMMKKKYWAVLLLFLTTNVSGCSKPANVEYKYPQKVMGRYKTDAPTMSERETIFGKGGMDLFGNRRDDTAASTGIGVNSFLWRATLDTIAFMPLLSADPFGGVIITDWYAPPETPNERFKINAYILDRTLRSDGIRVMVFRQERNQKNEWVDAAVNPNTASELENSILTRARELRIATNK